MSGTCPSTGLLCACPPCEPQSGRVRSREVTPAPRSSPGRSAPAYLAAYLAAVVVVQVRQAGRLGPGPRTDRGRRGIQADVHGGRGGGGGGSRGQCLGGRRWEPSASPCASAGGGPGAAPGGELRPPATPSPAPPASAIVRASGAAEGKGALVLVWVEQSPGSPPSPPPLVLLARPTEPFLSRLLSPRARGKRKAPRPHLFRNGTFPTLNIGGSVNWHQAYRAGP